MSKSHRHIFLENIDEIYENDGLWLSFRKALGKVDSRLWDERLFRRLDREKLRLVASIKSGALVLPKEFYDKIALELKGKRKPNESHIKNGKSSQTATKNASKSFSAANKNFWGENYGKQD